MTSDTESKIRRIRRSRLTKLIVLVAWTLFLVFTIGWWTPIVLGLMLGGYIGLKLGALEQRQQAAIERETYLPYQPGGQTVQVREYKSIAQFESDAQRRMAVGWSIQSQSGVPGGISLPGTIVKGAIYHPWAVISPSHKSNKVIVTWVRSLV